MLDEGVLMVKKRKTKEERHNQLIDCATRVFAKKGYKNATTREISKIAGISEKMLYVHFKNKKELFLKCLNKMDDDMRVGFRNVVNTYRGNPIEILLQFGLVFFDFLKKNRYASILGLQVRDINDRQIKEAYRKILETHVNSVEKTIKLAIEKGDMPSKVNPRAFAWIFVGSSNTFLMMEEFGFKELNSAFVKEMLDTLISLSC